MAAHKVDVVDSNGNTTTVTLPDYALETTQQAILKALTGGNTTDSKQSKSIETLVKGAKDDAKRDKKAQEEANKDRDENIKTLKEINKNSKEQSANLKKGGGVFNFLGDATKTLGGGFLQLSGAVIGSAVGAFINVAKSASDMGKVFADMATVGVGFDETATTAAITNLNTLGLTSKQAAGLLSEYSGVVQTVGKKAFTDTQRAFADMTGQGTQLGLTMAEAAGFLAEDLESRVALGIIGEVDAQKSAKRSADLYKMQLKNTQILGKSIDSIRGSVEQTLNDNETVKLAMLRATQSLGPEMADQLRQTTAAGLSSLSAMGVSQEMIDQMGMAMFDVNAFQSQGAQAMREALMATGTEAGREIEASLLDINEAVKAGDMDKVAELQAGLGDQFLALQQQMEDNPAAYDNFMSMVATMGDSNPMIKQLATSFVNLDRANQKLAEGIDEELGPMAKGAKAFEQAQGMFGGAIESVKNSLTQGLGTPLLGLMSGLTETANVVSAQGNIMGMVNGTLMEFKDANGNVIKNYEDLSDEQKKQADEAKNNNSVMGAFSDAMKEIQSAIMDLLAPVRGAEDGVGSMSDTIRSNVVPYIKKMGDQIADFIRDFDIGAAFESAKAGFTAFKDGLFAMIDAVKAVANFFFDLSGNEETQAGGVTLERNGETVAITDQQAQQAQASISAMADGDEKDKLQKQLDASKKAGMGMSADEIADVASETGAKTFMDRVNWLKIGGIIGGAIIAKMLISKGIGKIGDMIMGGGGGGGAAGGAVGKAAGGGLAATGKGIGALGKGIGKGIGGVFKGLAAGLTAFANPAILVGAAIFSGAIVLIGGAIAAATALMGLALPVFAEGMEKFQELDGKKLIDVGKGIGLIGVAMAAMGAGSVVGAVGNVLGNLFDMLPGKSPLEKLKEFAEADFDAKKAVENAEAMIAFSDAMAAINSVPSPSITGAISGAISSYFEVPSPIDELERFSKMNIDAEKVRENAYAMYWFSQAMTMARTVPDPSVSGAIAGAIGAYFGVPTPLDDLERFSQMEIDPDKVQTNAHAMAMFADAMTNMSAVPQEGIGAAISGAIVDFLGGGVTGYLDDVKEFGDFDLDADGVLKNANAMVAMSTALNVFAGAVQGMDDISRVQTSKLRELMNVMVEFGETFESMSPEAVQLMFAGIGANAMSADNIPTVQQSGSPSPTPGEAGPGQPGTGTGTDMTEGKSPETQMIDILAAILQQESIGNKRLSDMIDAFNNNL